MCLLVCVSVHGSSTHLGTRHISPCRGRQRASANTCHLHDIQGKRLHAYHKDRYEIPRNSTRCSRYSLPSTASFSTSATAKLMNSCRMADSPLTRTFSYNALYKSVFSFLRQLTTWHCRHSPAAAATDISRQPGPQHQIRCSGRKRQPDIRTDGRTPDICVDPGPDLQNILRQSYDYLTIMPKLRSTYDGRLRYRTSYEERKAFLRCNSLAIS